MDEIVQSYISNFDSETATEITRTFILLDEFEYSNLYDDFINMLMDESAHDPISLRDIFLSAILKKQEYVFEQHGLTLSDETTLWQRNEIIEALLSVQYLIDYSELYSLAEMEMHPIDFISDYFSYLSEIKNSDIPFIIEKYKDGFVENLKKFIILKHNEEQPVKNVDNRKIKWSMITKLKKFISFINNKPIVAQQFVRENIPIGLKFDFYIEILKDSLSDKISLLTPEDVFSLLMISEDGSLDSLKTFSDHSDKIYTNIDKINSTYSAILKYIKEFNDYIRVTSTGGK